MKNDVLELLSILYTRIAIDESTLGFDIIFSILWNNTRIEGV